MSAQAAILAAMTEEEYQALIEQYAALRGYRTYHTRQSKGSDRGFPDLCCVRDGRLVYLEVKTETGRVSPDQEQWIAWLRVVPGVIAMIVRPSDWQIIEEVLK